MTTAFLRLLLLIVVARRGCASAPAFADAAPRTLVRAHLEPTGPVVAGSEVKLVVDLLTTTWFTEAPNWPLFTVPDAIVSLPDEQADNLSEDIDGVQLVRRESRLPYCRRKRERHSTLRRLPSPCIRAARLRRCR